MRILKRKILLALSLPVDFFKKSEGFLYHPYSFIYYVLPYQRGSIRDAMGQLLRGGEVDKIIRNNIPYFRLTGGGRERLLSFFPISIGQAKVWDGKWKIIIISNIKHQKLKLREFCFRRLARGVYITPMPVSRQIKQFLLAKNLLAKVIVLESGRFLLADDQKMAKKIWNLEKLLKKYLDFIRRCRCLLNKIKSEKRLRNRDKNEVVELFNEYFLLLSRDPGLPKKVLPDDWPGDFAREKFLAIFELDMI